MQIATRCLTGNPSGRPTIASVFARAGIPGFVFIEGRPCDVSAAVNGLVTVYRDLQRLVPSDERARLLSSRNPLLLTHKVREGDWVRCLHGRYRNDVGLVCGLDPSRDAEVVVAFVPRIPEKATGSAASGSAKRKRTARPEPRKWTATQVMAVWGKHVKNVSVEEEEYELHNEKYVSGLLLKHLAPASFEMAQAPLDIGPFVTASYISDFYFCSDVAFRYAQDTIKAGQRVKVIAGELQGLVGYPTAVSDGVAIVPQTNGDLPPLSISVRDLTLEFLPGDHVQHHYVDCRGILSSVNNERRTVFLIEKDTNKEVRATVSLRYIINISLQDISHMDAIEPYSLPANFYQFTPGVWVHFSGPRDSERPKRRGYITSVEDGHVLVIDERTFTEVSNKISSADLAYIRRSSRSTRGSLKCRHPKHLPSRLATWSTLYWVEGSSSLRDRAEGMRALSDTSVTPPSTSNSKRCSPGPSRRSSHSPGITSGQCTFTLFMPTRYIVHFSLGRKRRKWPNQIQAVDPALHRLTLSALHRGP